MWGTFGRQKNGPSKLVNGGRRHCPNYAARMILLEILFEAICFSIFAEDSTVA